MRGAQTAPGREPPLRSDVAQPMGDAIPFSAACLMHAFSAIRLGCRTTADERATGVAYTVYIVYYSPSMTLWLPPSGNSSMVKIRSQSPAGRSAIAAEGRLGRVIRDSFTMPAADHELIGILKTRCLGLGIAIKKSELLRAGLAALERLPDEGLIQVAAAVESVKTGRPPGKKKKKKKSKKSKKRKNMKTYRGKGKRQ